MKNTFSLITYLSVLIVLIFLSAFLYSCTQEVYEVSNTPPTSADFFAFDRLPELNENIILTAEDYRDSNMKDIRARHGMLPTLLGEKIKEVLPYIQAVFSDAAVKEVLQVGTPVWNRSRFQGAAGEPVVMLVPLVQAGKENISGMLTIEIDQATGFVSCQSESRDELLAPYLESRKVEPGQEYVRLLSVAAFDKYIFDFQFLPSRYALDPRDDNYDRRFNNNLEFRNLDEFIFLSSCFILTVSYEGNELSQIICETVRITVRNPTPPTGPRNPPNDRINTYGGSIPGNPQGRDLGDGTTSRHHCEWEWPILGVYSGSGPLDLLATYIGDNPQLCHIYGGGLIVNPCDPGPFWNMSGNCSANVELQDRGSRMARPNNNSGAVFSKYRIVNNSTGTWGVTAAAPDIVGVYYEWQHFTSSSSVLANATRYYYIKPTMDCHDACQ